MACKDTTLIKKRLLSKHQEFEREISDIFAILETMRENVTEVTQKVLDKNPTINRRQFRSSYTKAVQTIETCLLKLMDVRPILENQSDYESGCDDSEDFDCRSIVSSDPIINDKFEQNLITSSSELKCESPTLLSFKQQSQRLPSGKTEVVAIQNRTDCLNTDVLCEANSSLQSPEPTKQATLANKFCDDHKSVAFSEVSKILLPQQKSNADKQKGDCLQHSGLPHGVAYGKPSIFDANSEESGETITNSEQQGEDIFSGCEAKFRNTSLYNQVGKQTEGLAHQFKDLNLVELVNTLAHLTEPKDSNGDPGSERFQKHVENIYKHVAPNVSGTIDKFHPSSSMTVHNSSLYQGSGEPLAVPHDHLSSMITPNYTSTSPALVTSTPAVLSDAVSSAGYNFEPFSKTTQVTVPVFSGGIMSHAHKKTPVQETPFHGKVAPGFSPILIPVKDHSHEVCDMVASTFGMRELLPGPTFPKHQDSVVPFALPRMQFDDGSVIIASMAHINSPSSFYIRPKSNDVSLEALAAKLSKYYDGSYLGLFTDKAEVGLICCALSYEDNNWYRAVIIKTGNALSPGYIDGAVTVRFVDKGITETLPLFRLRSLNADFFAISCLVVHCTLHNAKPPLNQTDWAEEQIETFSNLAFRNDLEVTVHGKLVTGELEVDLKTLEKSGSETIGVSILDCFVNAACCIGRSSACEDTPRASPVPIIIPDEGKNSKISFTINCKKNPVEVFRKKKPDQKKTKRLYKKTRASNETSDSDDDKPHPETAFKPPKCWEDLDSKSCTSSVEKSVNVPNTKMNEPNSPTAHPFPILHNIELNLSDYSFQEAMLAHVVSPSEFYVHPVAKETTYIDELTAELNKMYSKAQAPLAIVDKQSIPIGSFWCARFPKDGQWYRAKVLDVREIEDTADKLSHELKKKKKKLKTKPNSLESKFKVHVFYVDYGDSAWIESNDLRHLKKKFYKQPVMAVRCTLMSVHPKCDPNSKNGERALGWPPEAGQALQEWAREKTFRIQVFNAKDFQRTGEFQVLLWDLENEGILFNEEIVKSGLAESDIYCKDKQEESQCIERDENKNHDDLESLSCWDPMSSDFNDLRNSYAVDVDDAGVALTGYKACDESQICVFYQRGQLCKRGSNCRYKHIQPSSDGQTTDKKVIMGSNDIVPLPNINSFVVIDVTEVLSAIHFYANFPFSSKPLSKLKEEADSQFWAIESENLITLQTKLQSIYNDQFPRDGDYLLRAEGEIVVAKFSTDNEWYRARVIRADPGRSRVKVFYVDYGNCEWVTEINIRDIRPEFMHFPFQAVECRLADIELLSGDDEESAKKSRACFQQQVANRKLVAYIKDIVGNTLYIDLFYTENETDVNINWILVYMGYAKQNNGLKS